MAGWTKLFSSITTSSIWMEDNITLRVWIAMLASCDQDGIVEGSIPGFANICRVSIPELEKALHVLSSPDPYSRTKRNEGRRIRVYDGGWEILNYCEHRERPQGKEGSKAPAMRRLREERAKTSMLQHVIENGNMLPEADTDSRIQKTEEDERTDGTYQGESGQVHQFPYNQSSFGSGSGKAPKIAKKGSHQIVDNGALHQKKVIEPSISLFYTDPWATFKMLWDNICIKHPGKRPLKKDDLDSMRAQLSEFMESNQNLGPMMLYSAFFFMEYDDEARKYASPKRLLADNCSYLCECAAKHLYNHGSQFPDKNGQWFWWVYDGLYKNPNPKGPEWCCSTESWDSKNDMPECDEVACESYYANEE